MTQRFDADDLARAVTAGVLNPGQDHALLAFLRAHPSARPGFQLANVAFYFGALLIMGAMGWLLTVAWMSIGDGALLAISLAYVVSLTLLALNMQRRSQPVAAGVLAAVAVGIVPLAVFAVQRITGFWPFGDGTPDFQHYYRYVQGQWLLMEGATVIAGLLMLRVVPFPFIVMPMALALWFMSMDISQYLYGSDLSWAQRHEVSLWFGLALLLVAVVVDGRTRKDYAGWGYLGGLLAFWGGLTAMDSGSELGKFGYCVINVALMGLAVLLRRPVFMVFGALGVATYLGYLAYDVFAESLLFPLVLTLIGLGVIALGLAYQKRRERLTERLRNCLPNALAQALPALRR
ncbi:DUF2157 domain-containing protein [Pseudomonas sp. RP23018S]|uniref:DUF2157 domain-containing protein n=1 Tax=Pseudomonas sp. RP23018S TaxID=3096037 RepID=UPI002ACA7390|nr:DUF2157 domain-containing protein [Pseudomonas sp. RP23018S]MDZ5605005.1 DUF2157 domain-containing protein [Pseudomonas sp. RP23018S]